MQDKALQMRAHIEVSERVVTTKRRTLILDHALRLPMSSRIRRGMTTICDVCNQSITDEYFYGGFVTGHKNLLIHEECLPEAMRYVGV